MGHKNVFDWLLASGAKAASDIRRPPCAATRIVSRVLWDEVVRMWTNDGYPKRLRVLDRFAIEAEYIGPEHGRRHIISSDLSVYLFFQRSHYMAYGPTKKLTFSLPYAGRLGKGLPGMTSPAP
jgi:hypothetical protein